MIRKATNLDIDTILGITNACALFMIKNGIYQWNASYPNRKAFENDVSRGELYVIEIDNEVVGCIAISTFMDEEYKTIQWLIENNNSVYIHRLAIHPKHQGKGYARSLMDFAEKQAIDNSYSTIRLDTFSQNKRNQKFYEIRGYKKLGIVYFPNQSEHPFYCYELVI
ncbi:GNAT family N-acetyltransferase [Hanstruepera marina]|uniref:GNAT family N-acetyltransferase n=1 Tax=Hanstruepera marina TaxID=2873265 RepID=UPI001CA6D31C|nr:GNAT family N-acetyltransferase [Hanstruepera marina]